MSEEQKNKRKSIIATILFYVVLFTLMFFFGFKQLIPDTEEGVLISFGDTEMGSGNTQPVAAIQQPSVSESKSTPTPPVVTPTPTPVEEKAPEEVKTQDFDDEAPELKATTEKPKEEVKPKPDPEEEKRKAEEAERLRKQQEEELRKQKELEEQRKKEEAEKARKKAIEDQLAQLDKDYNSQQTTNTTGSTNPFSGKGTDATSTGKGNTTFPGTAGSPNGDPNSDASVGSGLGKQGNSFSLSGRKLSGKLPEPVYNVQEEGTVVVEIVVDQNGNVIGAKAILKGSTTQNATLQKVAVEAAQKARFNADNNAAIKQVGTITYHFQLD